MTFVVNTFIDAIALGLVIAVLNLLGQVKRLCRVNADLRRELGKRRRAELHRLMTHRALSPTKGTRP